jgi:hypothetical protein
MYPGDRSQKIIYHGDTEGTEFSFSLRFSVISVPPWLIFIPVHGPQAHVTLRTVTDPAVIAAAEPAVAILSAYLPSESSAQTLRRTPR